MADGRLASPEHAIAHLPPESAAPILAYYDEEFGTLSKEHLLKAPIDDRGVVDIFATVDRAIELLDPEYALPKQQCDVHHFVWERSNYMPWNNDGDPIPNQYREIPFHKGYLPRQLHNFLHTVVAPPPMPSMEVMEQRVESYLVAKRLFETARTALQFERHPLKGLTPKKRWRRERFLDDAVMKEVLQTLHGRYTQELAMAPDDTDFVNLDTLRERPLEEVATHLGRVAARNSINMMPYVYSNRLAS